MGKITYGFDLGTGSIGAAINENGRIVWSKVWLFDGDYASVADVAKKRRSWRTRNSHRAREYWLNHICEQAGIPILKPILFDKTTGDYRVDLEKLDHARVTTESSKDGTVFNSILLRILLLEGNEKLEGWQIYKALHSAIQKRGYETVPWAMSSRKNADDPDSKKKEEISRVEWDAFANAVGKDGRYLHPCYMSAWKMGLWDAKSKTILKRKLDCETHADGALDDFGANHGYTVSRKYIEGELHRLLENARKLFPGIDVDYALFGDARKKIVSLDQLEPKMRSKYEKAVLGLVAQKIPRFDNRRVNPCRLFPRFHAVRADDRMNMKHSYYSRLFNMRFLETSSQKIRPLSCPELVAIVDHIRLAFGMEKGIGKTDFKKHIESKYGLLPAYPFDEIRPSCSGRAVFSRPALFYLNRYYESGKSPADFHEWCLEQESHLGSGVKIKDNKTAHGLVSSDFEWLKILGERKWEDFFIPAEAGQRSASTNDILAHIPGAVVKNRVRYVGRMLDRMNAFIEKQFGVTEPDQIVVEFAREMLGQNAKKRIELRQKENKKENDEAYEELRRESGEKISSTLALKYKLAKKQGWKLLVPPSEGRATKACIAITDLDSLEIDHIVPVQSGGPDAQWNLWLLTREQNKEKGKRIPFEWLSGDVKRWKELGASLSGNKIDLHPRTKKLILAPDAPELTEKWTHLAETAWIARNVRDYLYAHYQWKNPIFGGAKRVHVVSGGLTGKVRAKFRLNGLLGDDKEKNRANPRHHALDAMVISHLSEWYSSEKTKEFFKFPRDDFKDDMASALEAVVPEKIGRNPPALEDNFYGLKTSADKTLLVTRRLPIKKLPYQPKIMKEVFSLAYLKKYLADEILLSADSRAKIEKFIASSEKLSPGAQESRWKALLFTQRFARFVEGRITEQDSGRWADNGIEFKSIEDKRGGGKKILKPKGVHKGQVVYVKEGRVEVRPIYAHENEAVVMNKLRKNSDEVVGRFRSGDVVELLEPNSRYNLQKGRYRLLSMWQTGVVALETLEGVKIKKLPLIKFLLESGFRIAQLE